MKGIKRVGTLGRKISRNFSVLFFSPPQKYYAPIFHHTPKYESPFQTVDPSLKKKINQFQKVN